MRSNVPERFAFGAHPRSRAHADTRAQRRADLRWTDCSDRVLRCAAPCAVRASTAQIARSRRVLESRPRNLGLTASFVARPVSRRLARMELKNFDHRTFKISGYRTLSL